MQTSISRFTGSEFFKAIVIVLFVFSSGIVFAQTNPNTPQNTSDPFFNNNPTTNAPEDTTTTEGDEAYADTLREPWPTLNGIRVGVDVIGIILGATNFDKLHKVSRYEVTGDIGIKRFFGVVDIGLRSESRRSQETNGYGYENTNKGSYFRIGGDVNLLPDRTSKNVIFLGLRYGTAIFNETGEFRDSVRYGRVYSSNLTNVNASWAEVVTGLKVFGWKNFYLGATFRVKFKFNVSNDIAFEIPGYGVSSRKQTVGLSYYIMYRIPYLVK